MQIIKDKQIIQDTWEFITDQTPLPPGDITVSLDRWQTDRENLLKHHGKLGLRLAPDQILDPIAADLTHFELIELDFPAYTDGRAFSQAWLLRNRYQYDGEIRAVGLFMRDQLFYLQRVGVNSFKLADSNKLDEAKAMLNDFSVVYQASTH